MEDIRVAVVPEIIDADGHIVGDVLNTARGEFIISGALPTPEIALRSFQAGIRYARSGKARIVPPLPVPFAGDVG